MSPLTPEKPYSSISFSLSQVNKIAQNTYPHLNKLLAQHYTKNGITITRRQRLNQFLNAVREFSPEDISDYTDRDGNVWIPVPRDSKLIDTHGGGASSWGNNIRMFCVLGLATPYNPDNHGKTNHPDAQHFRAAYRARKETEHMREYYKAHPEQKKNPPAHSPTFYLIPRYSKKRLAEAERRAAILDGFSVGKWGMDAIRDALGNEIANQAFDVRYNSIGPRTAEERERLKMAALKRVFDDGYFYPADVLDDALNASDATQAAEGVKEAEDIFEHYDEPMDETDQKRKRHFTRTWEQYLTQWGLLREMRWVFSPPSKAEREAYHLSNKAQIIRPP